MSERTKEINRVTKSIITVSWKLIVIAVAVMLLHEAIVQGYRFGHSLFYDTAAAEFPGEDMRVTIEEDSSLINIAAALEESGLIKNRFSFIIQSLFYEYGYKFSSYGNPVKAGTFLLNTSMTAKEIIVTLRDGNQEEETEESSAEE